MLIIVINTFAKILFELVEIILCLPLVSLVLYLIFSTLSIIYILLLLIIKLYISLYTRTILTKTKRKSFISQTGNIKREILNLKANIIINFAIHLGFFFKYLFDIKDVLYVVKKVVRL